MCESTASGLIWPIVQRKCLSNFSSALFSTPSSIFWLLDGGYGGARLSGLLPPWKSRVTFVVISIVVVIVVRHRRSSSLFIIIIVVVVVVVINNNITLHLFSTSHYFESTMRKIMRYDNVLSMWSLRWHFTNRSVTGTP